MSEQNNQKSYLKIQGEIFRRRHGCLSCCCSYFWLICAICAIPALIYYDAILETLMYPFFTLTPGTLFYQQFKEPTIPVYFSIYLWNVTNSDQFTFKPARTPLGKPTWTFPKPHVEQVGPFIFQEIWVKDKIVFVTDDGTTFTEEEVESQKIKKSKLKRVRARQKYDYVPIYDPNDASTGLDPFSNEYNLSVANVLAIGLPGLIEYELRNFPNLLPLGRMLVNDVLKKSESLPVLKNIKPFDYLIGYQEPMLDWLHQTCQNNPVCEKSEFLMNLPQLFGLLMLKNTALGWPYFEWNTGVDDINQYNMFTGFAGMRGQAEYNYRNGIFPKELPYWPKDSPYGNCNNLQGTDGSSSGTRIDKLVKNDNPADRQIHFYSADTFKDAWADYAGKVKSPHYQFTSYRFEVLEDAFRNCSVNPINNCYCYGNYFWDSVWGQSTYLNCLVLDGGLLVDIGYYGIPLLLSSPHFLYGPSLLEIASGNFTPNFDDHGTYLEFEGISGVVLKAGKKAQQNVVAIQNNHYDILSNVDRINNTYIIPFLWLEESTEITKDFEFQIYLGFVIGSSFLYWIWPVLLGLACVLIPGVGYLSYKKQEK